MLTTTRLCALFICLLRQCRACAYTGGNNSKKNHYDQHLLFSSLSLSLFFALHPKRLLSDYLKYLRASQHKIPSVTSRVFLFKSKQANEYDHKLFFLCLSLSHFLVVWNNETNARLSCLNILCRKGQQMKDIMS